MKHKKFIFPFIDESIKMENQPLYIVAAKSHLDSTAFRFQIVYLSIIVFSINNLYLNL